MSYTNKNQANQKDPSDVYSERIMKVLLLFFITVVIAVVEIILYKHALALESRGSKTNLIYDLMLEIHEDGGDLYKSFKEFLIKKGLPLSRSTSSATINFIGYYSLAAYPWGYYIFTKITDGYFSIITFVFKVILSMPLGVVVCPFAVIIAIISLLCKGNTQK